MAPIVNKTFQKSLQIIADQTTKRVQNYRLPPHVKISVKSHISIITSKNILQKNAFGLKRQ